MPEQRSLNAPFDLRGIRLLCGMSLLLSAAGLIALATSPLHAIHTWEQLAPWIDAVVGWGAVGSFLLVALSRSTRDALLLLGLCLTVSTGAELMGLTWGVGVFGGGYAYAEGFPRAVGDLPVFIPLTWFILACAPVLLLAPLCDSATRPPGAPARLLSWALPRALACAWVLTVFDLHIEPLGVYTGLWQWHNHGVYYGAPLFNLVGWFVVGMLIYLPFLLLSRPSAVPCKRPPLLLQSIALGTFGVWIIAAVLHTKELFGSYLPMLLSLPTLLAVSVYYVRFALDGNRVACRETG